MQLKAASLIALVLLVSSTAPALTDHQEGPVWLAGDWHVHTEASHDACAPTNATGFVTEMDPEEGCGDGPHTLSADGATRMRQAQARGLDYLRITDHNTLAGPRSAQAGYQGPVTLVPGYEHSLDGGHAGISSLDLLEAGRFESPPGTTEGFNDLVDRVHQAPGGLFVVNHPTDGDGEGWMRQGFDWSQVDAVEIWNIHWLYRDEVFQGTLATSENDQALDLWTDLLNEGHEIAIVGGSDNHWLLLTAIQGPGQPTTWVQAEAPTAPAILDAVRQGRTYVAWDPALPRLEVTATGPEGITTGLGGTVANGQVSVTVEVTDVPGDRLRLVSCQGIELETTLTSPRQTIALSTPLPPGCWIRADVVTVDDELGPNHLLYRAITSPIYVR